jgi:hypothetical protein
MVKNIKDPHDPELTITTDWYVYMGPGTLLIKAETV